MHPAPSSRARILAYRALGAVAGGWVSGVLGIAVWFEWTFPTTAAQATHVGEAVWAFALLALCGNVAGIVLGARVLREPKVDPFAPRSLAGVAAAAGAVGLLGVVIVALLGAIDVRCGQDFDACRSGWTRTG